MFIYYTMSPSPPSCRPPFRLIVMMMMMIQKCSLNRLKIEYAVIDDLYFLVIE